MLCTGIAKVAGSTPVQSLNIFSGLFTSSVMTAFASVIMSTFNCYCWTSITIKLKYLYLPGGGDILYKLITE